MKFFTKSIEKFGEMWYNYLNEDFIEMRCPNMTDKEQKAAAKKFAEYWNDKELRKAHQNNDRAVMQV